MGVEARPPSRPRVLGPRPSELAPDTSPPALPAGELCPWSPQLPRCHSALSIQTAPHGAPWETLAHPPPSGSCFASWPDQPCAAGLYCCLLGPHPTLAVHHRPLCHHPQWGGQVALEKCPDLPRLHHAAQPSGSAPAQLASPPTPLIPKLRGHFPPLSLCSSCPHAQGSLQGWGEQSADVGCWHVAPSEIP